MKLKKENLPLHIAFIMDGNGRWATRQFMPRKYGHKKGAEALKNIVDYCFSLGIKYVSCFAFSTENWQRPKDEIDYIFELLRNFIKEKRESNQDDIEKSNIRINIMGDISRLPNDIAEELYKIQDETKNCNKFVLNIALNYGGRDDIVHACNYLIEKGLTNITESDIANALYSAEIPDPDFIIRTGGDIRLSNFMLYQSAYTELYFTKTYWPDFKPKDLNKAISNYLKRNRKFGQVK